MSKAWEIPIFSKEEGVRRHKKIREMMAYRGIDCLVISGHPGLYRSQASDFRYVSNYCMWFADEYIVFPLEGEPTLFVWSLGHEDSAKKVSWLPIKVSRKVKGGRNYAGDVAGRIRELGMEKGTLGMVNLYNMPASFYLALREKLPEAEFQSARDILVQCRLIKSAEELEFLRRSGECGDKAIEALVTAARPGVNEYILAAECESAIIKAGGEHGNFILLDSGPWEERGAFLPDAGSGRILQKGDIILNELTPNYGGYYTQVLRPISLGKPSDDFLRLLEIHCQLYQIAKEQLRPGNTRSEITAKLVEFSSGKGDFSRVWALQDCELSETSVQAVPDKAEIKPGMVFVIHPSTDYSSGKGHAGHLLGDSYIVTEGEPECLSKLPIEVTCV
jgi:Xaa-Pro aminopeptidase